MPFFADDTATDVLNLEWHGIGLDFRIITKEILNLADILSDYALTQSFHNHHLNDYIKNTYLLKNGVSAGLFF